MLLCVPSCEIDYYTSAITRPYISLIPSLPDYASDVSAWRLYTLQTHISKPGHAAAHEHLNKLHTRMDHGVSAFIIRFMTR